MEYIHCQSLQNMHCMGAFVHGEAAVYFCADFRVIEEMEPSSFAILCLKGHLEWIRGAAFPVPGVFTQDLQPSFPPQKPQTPSTVKRCTE